MDNNNLKAVVKKLERDILAQEIENASQAANEQTRSNSVPLRFKRQNFQVNQSKKNVLNPFLKVQMKMEVVLNQQDLVKKSNLIIGSVNKVPTTDKNIIQALAKDLKAVEAENHLLRQEIDYLKRSVEQSEHACKVSERKLSIISSYFKDSLSRLEEEDPNFKRYKVLIGVLASTNPSNAPDWGTLLGYESRSHQVDRSSANLSTSNMSGHHRHDSNRRLMIGDVHTVDSSNRSSSNLNLSTDGRRKRDKLLKATKKMRLKCEEFLKKFEEVEEAERLAKLKAIEETRRQSNLNKGSFLTPGGETPSIQSVIASISARTNAQDSKILAKPKDPVLNAQSSVKPQGATQTSSSNFI